VETARVAATLAEAEAACMAAAPLSPRPRSAAPGMDSTEGVLPTQSADAFKTPKSPKCQRTTEDAVADNPDLLRLVPADLRGDLDRATQAEAVGNLSEALAIYTDCIRRLAPIYKRKLEA
jgi:hypothetical protein